MIRARIVTFWIDEAGPEELEAMPLEFVVEFGQVVEDEIIEYEEAELTDEDWTSDYVGDSDPDPDAD